VSSDSIERNRAEWTRWAAEFVPGAERKWATDRISWGVWHVPETELRVLPDLDGKDVIELGCGTAYVSAWLARHGARPVGVDPTPAQLETARRMQREHDLEFPLVEAPAEEVPLPDASFDLAVSEYGASIWADPQRWIPEAARLLRPGGHLVFLVNGTVFNLCAKDVEAPPDTTFQRDYFGMYRVEWSDDDSVNFYLGYGDWIRLLRANAFEVERLVEIQAPEDAEPHRYDALPKPDWARQWPSEDIWVARKVR
jgi:ubiquinone/menaquinone biosynthesis C-methylase UbiE